MVWEGNSVLFYFIFLIFFPSIVKISREEAQGFAREHRIHYMEASAKNRYNVDEAFLEVVRAIRSLTPSLPQLLKRSLTHTLSHSLTLLCFSLSCSTGGSRRQRVLPFPPATPGRRREEAVPALSSSRPPAVCLPACVSRPLPSHCCCHGDQKRPLPSPRLDTFV